MRVGMKVAKNELSRIIKQAMAGEEAVITRRGQPMVRLTPEPVAATTDRRGAGCLKDVLVLPEDWDSPEAEEEFENLFDFVREAKGLPQA
jgi:prevent-host-death family protein